MTLPVHAELCAQADIITSKDLGRFMELRSVLRAELAEACK